MPHLVQCSAAIFGRISSLPSGGFQPGFQHILCFDPVAAGCVFRQILPVALRNLKLKKVGHEGKPSVSGASKMDISPIIAL